MASVAQGSEGYPRGLSLSGDLGFGGMGNAALTTLHSGIDVREGQLALGLFGRVRLVMADTAETHGTVRNRDWDEVSDYVHILRYLHYRRRFESYAVQVQGGEFLSYTMGHGTILRGYSNVADPDHLHAGALARLEHEYFDFSVMVDNFVNPKVIASRATVSPWPSWDRLRFGFSFVADPQAPRTIRENEQGVRQIDSGANLVADTEVLTVTGFDMEYRFGDVSQAEIVPYADFNLSSEGGVGLHLGTQAEVALGDSGAQLQLKLEYHASTGGYIPAQFQTFYDLERYQAGLAFSHHADADVSETATMLAGIKRRIYDGHGLLAQVGVGRPGLGELKIGFSQRPGPDGRLFWTRATLQPDRRLNFGALLLFRGFAGPHSSEGGGIGAAAEVRYRITSYLYGLGQYTRSWFLGQRARYYGIFNSFNIGLGGTWSG